MNHSAPQSPTPSVSLWKRLVAPCVIALLLIGLVLFNSPNFGRHTDEVGSPIAGDFLQEWIGAYSLRVHGAESLFDHDHLMGLQHDEELLGFRWTENQYFAMVYPPFYYLLWVPLSLVPYQVAAWIFIVGMIACFLVAHALLMTTCPGSTKSCSTVGEQVNRFANWAPWLLVPATLYVPLIRSITTGQKGTLCLLILVLTYLLYLRSKKFASGVSFGLMAFKPQLALVIGLTMLFRRQWRFVAGSVLIVSASVGLCFAMGSDTCWQYTQFCLGAGEYVETSGYDLYKSHCLIGFFALLGGGESTIATKIGWALSALVIGLLLSRMFHNHRDLPNEVRKPIEFSALLLATLLLTPHLFSYDLTILLLPMYLLTGLLSQPVFSRKQSIRLGVLLVALFVVSGFSHIIAAKFGLQISTLVMLGIFGTITWEKPGVESSRAALPFFKTASKTN